MTFTGMSAGDPYRISSLSECGKDKFRTHSAGAGNPDNPDIGRIFHPADPCKICCPVRAPVAQKAYDFNFFITHFINSPLNHFYTTSPRANICEKIWLVSNPLRCRAPERQEATQRPQPLQRTGLTSASPANRPSTANPGAL